MYEWLQQWRKAALFAAIFAHFEDCQKSLLWNVDFADSLHALLAFFLLLQKLAFATDVSPVALGQHILTQRRDRFPGDDLGSNRRLNSDLEHLPGDQLAHF